MIDTQHLKRRMPQIININELAYLTGSTPAAVRQAGAALFESLSGDDPDLSRALIAACSESGVEPRNMIAMMNVLALEFRRAAPEADDPDDTPTPDKKKAGTPPMMKRLAARARAQLNPK